MISALGGSRAQIGGPTGAFVVVVAGIVSTPRPRRAVHVHAHGRRDPDPARHHRHGHRGEVHPASRRHWLHERHRRPHREHPDPRSLRPADRRIAGRFPRPRCGCSPRSATRRPPSRRSRLGTHRGHSISADGRSRRIPGSIFVLLAGTAVGAGARRAARHDRHAIRRRARRACRRLHVPHAQTRHDAEPAVARADRRDARRHRVAALGGGGRPHVRSSPRSERRADGAGNRQRRSRRSSADSRPPAPSREPRPTSARARARRSPA